MSLNPKIRPLVTNFFIDCRRFHDSVFRKQNFIKGVLVLQIRHKLCQWVSCFALVAALAAALLPDGYVPKVAGPCGKVLCNCPFSPDDSETELTQTTPEITSSLRWVECSISGTEAPGTAYQLVLAGVETPIGYASNFESIEQPRIAPMNAAFSLLNVHAELFTPPPRA